MRANLRIMETAAATMETGNVENVTKLRIMMRAIAQTVLLADFLHLECLIDQYHCRSKYAIRRFICS